MHAIRKSAARTWKNREARQRGKNNLCQSVKSPIRGPVFFVEIRGIREIRGHAFISREEREDTRSRDNASFIIRNKNHWYTGKRLLNLTIDIIIGE